MVAFPIFIPLLMWTACVACTNKTIRLSVCSCGETETWKWNIARHTLLMLSWPPATTIVASPFFIDCIPRTTDFKPEPHSMLTPHAGTEYGIPAFTLACLAGFWPWAGDKKSEINEASQSQFAKSSRLSFFELPIAQFLQNNYSPRSVEFHTTRPRWTTRWQEGGGNNNEDNRAPNRADQGRFVAQRGPKSDAVPAVNTWPKMTSDTSSGDTSPLFKASWMTTFPKSCAGREDNAPLKEPEKMKPTESVISKIQSRNWRLVVLNPDRKRILFWTPSLQFGNFQTESSTFCSEFCTCSVRRLITRGSKMPGVMSENRTTTQRKFPCTLFCAAIRLNSSTTR